MCVCVCERGCVDKGKERALIGTLFDRDVGGGIDMACVGVNRMCGALI